MNQIYRRTVLKGASAALGGSLAASRAKVSASGQFLGLRGELRDRARFVLHPIVNEGLHFEVVEHPQDTAGVISVRMRVHKHVDALVGPE
jgi:hypothetical protein